LIGLFGKLGLADLTIPALMFWRFLSASLLLFIALWIGQALAGILTFHHLKIQLLRAFFVLLAQYCFLYYLTHNRLLNASALLNTGPLFISLIEWGILRKKVGVSSWMGALVSFIGALLILQPTAEIFSVMSGIGLLSGLSQGASQVVFGIHSEREETPHVGVLHLFILCTCFSALVLFFFPQELQFGKQMTSWDVTLIVLLGIASVINQIFRAQAYAHGTPSRLAAFLYFAVLLSGIWDWLIFHKSPNALAAVGAILVILGGMIKIYLRHRMSH
jgi:drug/metabolite transporter (DMT)-like permease